MSNSISINDYKRFSSGKKMNFSQTCNLLSKFVKDKGSPNFPINLDSDLGGRSEGKKGSTMNLFPVKEADDINGSVGHTINLFPLLSGFHSSEKKRASPEPPATQMTIFYGGKVTVFNGLPSDKAKEVMNLASTFESSLKKKKVEAPVSSVPVSVSIPSQNPSPNPNLFPNLNPSLSHSQSLAVGTSNLAPTALPRALISRADLPIARKASLHRFLEKRKDRLVSKAPTLASTNVSDGNAMKPIEGRAWLGLNSLPAFQQKPQ